MSLWRGFPYGIEVSDPSKEPSLWWVEEQEITVHGSWGSSDLYGGGQKGRYAEKYLQIYSCHTFQIVVTTNIHMYVAKTQKTDEQISKTTQDWKAYEFLPPKQRDIVQRTVYSVEPPKDQD